ncbi:calumenin-B-like isoform X2 [Festucalex cinctus]
MKLQPFLMCFALCVVYATGKPTEKGRVRGDEPLNKRKHDDAENFDYDREAFFLGEQEAMAFDQLTPEQSKERLGMLVVRIDEDKDGFVTMEEMKKWLQDVQKRWIYKNTELQWDIFDLNGDGVVSWDEYKNVTYVKIDDDTETNEGLNYRQIMAREERRFMIADLNGDQKANKTELAAFIHPEHFKHMEEIMVLEMIEEMDKNGDGVIDIGEYTDDMYRHDGKREPEWVIMDRKQFTEVRDKNKDGKMDVQEVREWILTTEYDQDEAEAKHLIYEADKDK